MYLLLREKHPPKIKSFHYFVVSIILFLILLSVNQLADAGTPKRQKNKDPWRFYNQWSKYYDANNSSSAIWKPSAKSVELTRLNGANAEVVGSEERISWGSTYRATVTAPGVNIRYEWWTFDNEYEAHQVAGHGSVVNTFYNKTKQQEDQYVDYSDFNVTDEHKQQCLGVIAFNMQNEYVLGSFTNCNIGEPLNEGGVVSYVGKIKKGKVIRAMVSDGNGLNSDNINYQWQWTNNKTKGWKNFAGQTNATFKLRGKWAGKKHVQVVVTYTDNHGYSETRHGPKIDKNKYK